MQDIPVWRATYTDGSVLDERDGDPPFRAIDWARVAQLELESVNWKVQLAFAPLAAPLCYRLMRRRLVNAHHGELGIMMVVTETPTAVQSVFYWLPDNTTHVCADLDCPRVRQYAAELLAGTPGELAETD